MKAQTSENFDCERSFLVGERARRFIRTVHAGVLSLAGLSFIPAVAAQSDPGDIVGKVTVGYQGWFAAGEPNPPDNWTWSHWANYQPPTPGVRPFFKSWPDMRPYQTLENDAPMQYATNYGPFANGLPATLFTSFNRDVVDIHMRWLGSHGKPTVAIQRFNPTGRYAGTLTAANVLATAPQYGVKFYIDYDLTDWSPNVSTQLPADWTDVIQGQLHMTDSPSYARQNGKPVVQLWISNAVDAAIVTPSQITALIHWLQDQGAYVIVGTSRSWRTGNPDWLATYSEANMIQPWMIGVIGSIADTDRFVDIWRDDIAYATAHGFDFQASVLPGDNTAPTPQRLHGDFMWRQFANAVTAGVRSVYVSMYDEYNEGDQIMPTAEDVSMIPVGTADLYPPLDIDGTHCSSDYYLRLTDDGQKMLRGEIGLTYSRPTPPVVPVRLLRPGTVVSFQALANGGDVLTDVNAGDRLFANTNTIGASEMFSVVDAGSGRVALRSLITHHYVSAENAGSAPLAADRPAVGLWESFTEVTAPSGNIALLALANGNYVSADPEGIGALIADAPNVSTAQIFMITHHPSVVDDVIFQDGFDS